MTGRHNGTRRAAWATVVVLVLTGGSVLGGGAARADDGIDKLSAQQIADRSRDALLSVRSLHLTARGDLGGGSPRRPCDSPWTGTGTATVPSISATARARSGS